MEFVSVIFTATGRLDLLPVAPRAKRAFPLCDTVGHSGIAISLVRAGLGGGDETKRTEMVAQAMADQRHNGDRIHHLQMAVHGHKLLVASPAA